MESKVKEYRELYSEFEAQYTRVLEVEGSINDIEYEIGQIREVQQQVNYNDPGVVIGYMEEYVNDAVSKERETLWNEVIEEIEGVTKSENQIQKNLNIAYKWLTVKKLKQCAQETTKDYGQHILAKKAEKAVQLKMAHVLNILFSFVFRFDFLRFLPKALRITAGILFWAIFLIPKIVMNIYNRYNTYYMEHPSGIPKGQYEQTYEQIRELRIEKLIQSCIVAVVATAVLMVVLNILVYYMAKYLVKKYVTDNAIVYLAIVDPIALRKEMFDYRFSVYMNGTVARWNGEIAFIQQNGFDQNAGDNTLYVLIRNDLTIKYNVHEENIREREEKIANLQGEREYANALLWDMVPQLKQKETEVDSIVQDSNHNNAVLSPYVAAGYSQFCIYGVKRLLCFEHNYKPMMICYNDETIREGERFVKNAARLIELFMNGFYQENYYAYINMWLVDFEGLHFPESRTKGLMKVIRTQQELQELFCEIKSTRETVDSLADGLIYHINPDKLKQHENPIHYNIVYFIGNEFNAVDREISQLFIDGQNYGFLPIVFMNSSLVQVMLNDNGLSRIFSKVVAKMQKNQQIYGFEGLVSEFEYELMVSNQKRLLDEKVCVNRIISIKELRDIWDRGNNLEFDKILYVDTYELPEDIYNILNFNCVQLFTINDMVPEFIHVDVMKL